MPGRRALARRAQVARGQGRPLIRPQPPQHRQTGAGEAVFHGANRSEAPAMASLLTTRDASQSSAAVG